MSAASLDEEPKLSFAVPAGSGGRDGVGKSPRPPQVPPEGEEDEGIHSDEEEVLTAVHV